MELLKITNYCEKCINFHAIIVVNIHFVAFQFFFTYAVSKLPNTAIIEY